MAGDLESDVIGSDRRPPANSKGLDSISLHVAVITRGMDKGRYRSYQSPWFSIDGITIGIVTTDRIL